MFLIPGRRLFLHHYSAARHGYALEEVGLLMSRKAGDLECAFDVHGGVSSPLFPMYAGLPLFFFFLSWLA